jgi:hypothetical protein
MLRSATRVEGGQEEMKLDSEANEMAVWLLQRAGTYNLHRRCR